MVVNVSGFCSNGDGIRCCHTFWFEEAKACSPCYQKGRLIIIPANMFSIADNLKSVSQRIKKATNSADRDGDSVRLLAVTKTRTAEELQKAYHSGLKCFGENYLNEALTKQDELSAFLSPPDFDQIEWHFIGPIQSNKTRSIATHFDWVQAIDREKIARRLNDQRPEDMAPLKVCVQININDEESKSGIVLDELANLAKAIDELPNLQLKGLMTIPNASQSEEELAKSFQIMLETFKTLQNKYPSVDTLSMGMSGDIELAIANGSNMVRVGTALFGPRK